MLQNAKNNIRTKFFTGGRGPAGLAVPKTATVSLSGWHIAPIIRPKQTNHVYFLSKKNFVYFQVLLVSAVLMLMPADVPMWIWQECIGFHCK